MNFLRANREKSDESKTSLEPYAKLVDCIESFLKANGSMVGDIDGDPNIRGLLFRCNIGQGIISILDGSYALFIQGNPETKSSGEERYLCNDVMVSNGSATVETYTKSVKHFHNNDVIMKRIRLQNLKKEKLDKKSTEGLKWLIEQDDFEAFIDEDRVSYNG